MENKYFILILLLIIAPIFSEPMLLNQLNIKNTTSYELDVEVSAYERRPGHFNLSCRELNKIPSGKVGVALIQRALKRDYLDSSPIRENFDNPIFNLNDEDSSSPKERIVILSIRINGVEYKMPPTLENALVNIHENICQKKICSINIIKNQFGKFELTLG